jgi:hypothetical protein
MLSELTEAHEQALGDQVMTDDQPGAVLRDFEMLLDFLGAEGVDASGKYNLLPIKLISELEVPRLRLVTRKPNALRASDLDAEPLTIALVD